MFLAKIRDSFMFNGSHNKSHWYLVYKRKNKVTFLKRVTHMYIADKNRFKQRNKGILQMKKVTSFDAPQGIFCQKIKSNYKGEPLTLENIKKNSVAKYRNNIRTILIKEKRQGN